MKAIEFRLGIVKLLPNRQVSAILPEQLKLAKVRTGLLDTLVVGHLMKTFLSHAVTSAEEATEAKKEVVAVNEEVGKLRTETSSHCRRANEAIHELNQQKKKRAPVSR